MKKIAAATFLWLATLNVALAQPRHFIPATKPSNLPNTGDFGLLLTKVINYFLGLVGLVAVLMFVIAGFQYLTSGGNEQTIEKAKHTLLYAVIGIVIVALSFGLVYTLTRSLRFIDVPPGGSEMQAGDTSGGLGTAGTTSPTPTQNTGTPTDTGGGLHPQNPLN